MQAAAALAAKTKEQLTALKRRFDQVQQQVLQEFAG
jgi:hypothetical protein